MGRLYRPYRVYKRPDTKSWEFSLTTASGLPEVVCALWCRKSFHNLPPELAILRDPKSKTAAENAVTLLIQYLAKAPPPEQMEREQAATPQTVISTASSLPLIQYISDFWTPASKYVQEKAVVKKEPLSAEYVKTNHEDVQRHIAPFPGFQGATLGSLTAGLIRDWMIWAAWKGLSGRRINTVLQSMRVAVRDAVNREELEHDPFLKVHPATEQLKERGILTPIEVADLLKAPIGDPRERLTMLLGVLCGMRRGEIRGLRWEDIDDGIIRICHNWQNAEGLKGPKCGSIRSVPIPDSVGTLLEVLHQQAGYPDQGFVLEFEKDVPVKANFFRLAFAHELEAIGISGAWSGKEEQTDTYINWQKKRHLTFHGLRHTFVTLGRLAGITDLEIQALVGHKDASMMSHYSHPHQVLDFVALRSKFDQAIKNATGT